MANSNKLQRTNDDIRFVLSRLLPQVKDPRVKQGELVSITRVDTTGDLRYCKVWISVLEEEYRDPMIRALEKAKGYIRRELGRRVQLRYVPELLFEADTNMEYAAKIDTMLKKLEKEHDEN